jgi:hypothetical protein
MQLKATHDYDQTNDDDDRKAKIRVAIKFLMLPSRTTPNSVPTNLGPIHHLQHQNSVSQDYVTQRSSYSNTLASLPVISSTIHTAMYTYIHAKASPSVAVQEKPPSRGRQE